MKTKLLILLAAFCAFALWAQTTNRVTRDFWVNVNSSTNLNVARLRIIGSELILDQAYTNWQARLHVEAWNSDQQITRSGDVTLTFAQLKVLFNAADPAAALENAALNKFTVTKKP